MLSRKGSSLVVVANLLVLITVIQTFILIGMPPSTMPVHSMQGHRNHHKPPAAQRNWSLRGALTTILPHAQSQQSMVALPQHKKHALFMGHHQDEARRSPEHDGASVSTLEQTTITTMSAQGTPAGASVAPRSAPGHVVESQDSGRRNEDESSGLEMDPPSTDVKHHEYEAKGSAAPKVVKRFAWQTSEFGDEEPKFADYKAKSLAVCVTGQVSRLELASKLRHIVIPNLRHMIVHVFLQLGNDPGAAYIFTDSMFENGPYMNFTAEALERKAWETVQAHGEEHPDDLLLPFGVHARLYRQDDIHYTIDDQWLKHLDPWGGSRQQSYHDRARLYMRQFDGISRCMNQVEEYEGSTGNKFDLVMRVRDDGFAMADWVLDANYAHGFTTLDCQQWTGLHDMSYVMGRTFASDVLHSMIRWRTNSTLLRDNLPQEERYPQNPERWLLAVVTAFNMPIRKLSVCDIPMVTTRFVKGGRLVVKDSVMDHIMAGAMLQKLHLWYAPRTVEPLRQSINPVWVHAKYSRQRRQRKMVSWGQQCDSCKPTWINDLLTMGADGFWATMATDEVQCGHPNKLRNGESQLFCSQTSRKPSR